MKKLTSLLLAIGVFCATAFTASAQAPLQYRVDDVADLLAITLYGSDAKVTAWVGGNSTRDDGLGGMFYYDGNSSAATNVYAVFKPTNNNGRWFKLPTAVAWQNASVTVGDDTTYGFKFLRGTGQTNFFGIGADNNIAYLQTFNGKNLHINNLGNNTILNATAGRVGIATSNPAYVLDVSDSVAASDVTANVQNTDNTSTASHAQVRLSVGGSAGGDPRINFSLPAEQDWMFGVDNTDSNKLKIAPSAALETSTALTIDITGNVGVGTATGAAKLSVNGGVHVGGDSDPGDNNLAVDGTALVTGAITNSALTASLPVFTDASKVLVSQSVAATKTALGIQAGTAITTADNTVTNTFATAFSVAPVVVTTPTGAAGTTCLTNAVISVSTTGFVYNCGVPSVTIQWVAIGAP